MWPDRELHQHQLRFRFSFHSARFGLLNIYCVCAEFPLQFVLGFLLYFGFFMATPPPPPPPSPAAHSRLLILNPKPFTHQQLGTLLSPLHLMCPMCVCVCLLLLSPAPPPPPAPSLAIISSYTKERRQTDNGNWKGAYMVKLSPSSVPGRAHWIIARTLSQSTVCFKEFRKQ